MARTKANCAPIRVQNKVALRALIHSCHWLGGLTLDREHCAAQSGSDFNGQVLCHKHLLKQSLICEGLRFFEDFALQGERGAVQVNLSKGLDLLPPIEPHEFRTQQSNFTEDGNICATCTNFVSYT